MIASNVMERVEKIRDVVKGIFDVYRVEYQGNGFEVRLLNADVPANSEIWTGTMCVSWYDEAISAQVDGREKVSFTVAELNKHRSADLIGQFVSGRLHQAYLCAVVRACQGILKTPWAKTIIKDRKKVKV